MFPTDRERTIHRLPDNDPRDCPYTVVGVSAAAIANVIQFLLAGKANWPLRKFT